MKTRLLLFIAIFTFSNFMLLQAQITSVANGNWTSPITWGGVPPTPGTDVIINHAVVLDMDYGFASGSITINGAGSLTGNSGMRALALIQGGNGTLTINGTLNIARMALLSGSLSNNGTVQNDSLYNAITFNNNTGATVNASQLMNSTGAYLINNGQIITNNFLNIEAVTNNNIIAANDFMNCKDFTNASTGTINIVHDFLNSDSLTSPATFVNNGTVNVGNNWLNTQSVSGSGKFCIVNNTSNTGLMTGTLDFCDQTGGNIDVNTGTIQPTITWCLYPCGTATDENTHSISPVIFPLPCNDVIYVTQIDYSAILDILDLTGRLVYSALAANSPHNVSSLVPGMYLYRLTSSKLVLQTGKILKH